jgi:hypothetical protein
MGDGLAAFKCAQVEAAR